ncbi:MAG TPA: protein kinase, partial [Polyangiaceae bacterium]
LHPHLASEKEFVEMFLDEARIAARIHHPNVVSILEVGASADGYFLVMEYIEGDTLAELVAPAAKCGQRVPTSIALRIALDMLSGLHAAHELHDDSSRPIHLVHRDVSPQNVLVGVDGIARITDFGVVHAASHLTNTRVGQLKGKIAYMAPEQAAGEESLDRRADVFASGIVIWEVLAGKRLFKAENEAATLARILTEPVLSLSRAAPGLDSELSNVVMRALERDRSRRFGTCAEFADALESAAGIEGVATPRELAAYVTAVLGEEILARRDAVRAWIADSESGQIESPAALPSSSGESSEATTGPSSTHSGSTHSGQTPNQAQVQPAPPPRRSALIVILALLLFIAIGGGFWLVSAAGRSHSVAARPPPATTVSTALSPPPARVTAAVPTASVAPPRVAVPDPLAPQRPRPAAKAAEGATKRAAKKPGEGVDLRNPYR